MATIANENLYVNLCISKQDPSYLRGIENTHICVPRNKTKGIIANIINIFVEYFKPSIGLAIGTNQDLLKSLCDLD